MPPPPFNKPEPAKDIWFEIIILLVFIAIFGGALLGLLYSEALAATETILAIIDVIIKPIFIVFDIILIYGIIYAIARAWPYRPTLHLFEKPPEKRRGVIKDPRIAAAWARIMEKASADTLESLRLAIIEADALVDSVLKNAGYEGDHLADRLQEILPEEVPSLERLWRAHRLRNDIVHTPGFAVLPQDARFALSSFEKFLKELNAL